MAATVPRRSSLLTASGVVSAATVAGATWGAIGAQANHLLGASAVLIPQFTPDFDVAIGATVEVPLTIWPRYQSTHRIWSFCATTVDTSSVLTVTLPDGGEHVYRASADAPFAATFLEALAGVYRTDVEKEVVVKVVSSATSAKLATVRLLGCFEARRGELETGASDRGVAIETLRSGLPIFDGVPGQSVGYVVTQVEAVRETCRRAGLFYATPFYTTVSATFATPLQQQPYVLARKRFIGDVLGVMQVRAYCRAAVGSVGELRVTMASGAVATWTIPDGFSGMIRGSLLVDCDDLSGPTDGRQSSRYDTATIEVRRVSGGGIIYLDTVSAGEAARSTDSVQASTTRAPAPHIINPRRPRRGSVMAAHSTDSVQASTVSPAPHIINPRRTRRGSFRRSNQ